jgi:hypothetical protein
MRRSCCSDIATSRLVLVRAQKYLKAEGLKWKEGDTIIELLESERCLIDLNVTSASHGTAAASLLLFVAKSISVSRHCLDH